MKVWVLVINHREGNTITAHASEELAKAELWQWCDDWWDHEVGTMYDRPDTREGLVEAYFAHDSVDETANIEECEVEGVG